MVRRWGGVPHDTSGRIPRHILFTYEQYHTLKPLVNSCFKHAYNPLTIILHPHLFNKSYHRCAQVKGEKFMQTAEILIFAKKVEVKIRFSLFIYMSI